MRCLALGYMTIEQIQKSSYEIEDSNFRRVQIPLNIQPYECYIQPETMWNLDMVDSVIDLVKRLYEGNEFDRAKSLFKNWFSGMNILKIYTHIVSDDENMKFLSPRLKNIANNLAECVCRSGELSILQGIGDLTEINEQFTYYLTEAVLKHIFAFLSGKELATTLGLLEVLLLDPLVEGIKKLLNENKYTDIKCIEEVLHDRLFRNGMGILLDTFMQIVAGTPEWSNDYKEELWNQIKDVKLPDNQFENLMTYYSIYAIVAAYLRQQSRTIVASFVTDRYIEKHKHSNRKYFGMYFNNICCIGKWIYAKHMGRKFCENAIEMKLLMNALFVKRWNPNDRDSETIHLSPFILKAYIMLSRNEPVETKSIVDDICETVFSINPVNQLLEAGIFYYQNDKKRIQKWFNEWLAKDGKVWNESIGERNQIIQNFCIVKEKYDTDNSIDMSDVLEKARWSIIGYASQKEYTGDYLLKWYNVLVEYNDNYIWKYAEKVKEVSDKIEVVGDNRLDVELNNTIFADIFSGGYPKIKEILKNNHYLAQGFKYPSYFVEGLIGYIKNAILEEELLYIWTIGIGLLDWRNEDNHVTIYSLQKAIELCAKKNGIGHIYNKLREYGTAYIDLVLDSEKDSVPGGCYDFTTSVYMFDEPTEIVKNYISCDASVMEASKLRKVIRELIERDQISEQVFGELLRYEFEKESYSIIHNEFLEYLVEKTSPDVSEQEICKYLNDTLKQENCHLELDLPELVRWKMKQQGEIYCKEGMEEILKMQRSWMTAAGHFKEPEIEEEYSYCHLIDWEKVDGIETLFYQIMKMLILSEDADAVQTALTGLFGMVRCNDRCIKSIEMDWNTYHYRAKEWLMMLYELLWYFDKDSRDILYEIIQKHCKDDDFNVALYSNIMLETLFPEKFQKYLIEDKGFFSEIPLYGVRKLIKTPRNTSWINGYDCVMEMKERIEKCLQVNLNDVEKRTANYMEQISEIPELIKLNRSTSCRVVCDKVNIAFFRVLYKDWASGRWNGAENKLARIVLSASEPYILLNSPYKWNRNEGTLISNVDKFIELSREEQLAELKDIFNKDVSEEETVLAGTIVDYTYKKEICGFELTYINALGMKPEYAAWIFERNSRLLLQQRDDFSEKKHCNITMHHNGIESFKQSNIMCGFSKRALQEFGWHISIDVNGVRVFDESGEPIGRLEYYYGNRTCLGNRYHSNQPYMQRWIVSKRKIDEKTQKNRREIKRVLDISIKGFE